jgi:hypothetical protein
MDFKVGFRKAMGRAVALMGGKGKTALRPALDQTT